MVRPFRTPGGEYTASIALDSSTVGETTVSVAVFSTRTDEIEVLETLYRNGENLQFKPFYHKSNDLDPVSDATFFENVIEENNHRLSSLSHVHRGSPNTHQVEAVHSALLVMEVVPTEDRPLVLVDGDRQKGEWFTRAIDGIGAQSVPVTHCIQAELYYPSSLLSDLTAYYLADSIENGRYDFWNSLLRAPRANRVRENWGRAYSGLYASTAEYRPPDLDSRRGRGVKERVRCWYDGAMALSPESDPPPTDSITPVVNRLRHDGHRRIADALSEL